MFIDSLVSGGMMMRQRHRQQHVAVVLRRGEAHRHAGIALAARQRLDAGAHLFGDARGGEEAEAQHHQHQLGHLGERREQHRHHVVPEEHLHQQGMLRNNSTHQLAERTSQGLSGSVRRVPTRRRSPGPPQRQGRHQHGLPQAEISQSR
jgi:hypothetical protein